MNILDREELSDEIEKKIYNVGKVPNSSKNHRKRQNPYT